MRWLLFFGFLFIVILSQAQPRPEIDLEDFAERLFQIQDEDINYEDLYESLLLYYTNPINLNRSDRDELSSLYLLSPFQLNSFFSYREQNGKLLSLYELQAIPGFDMGTIRALQPFVTVHETLDPRPLLTRMLNEKNNYLLLRYSRTLQAQEGYKREDGSGYTGDPNTLYGRFRVSHSNDFSMGMTFEKDAGETLSFDPHKEKYGLDYYSFHFLLENKGRIKNLAIGDYQMQFGQGLVLGAGFGAGKGAETTNSIKRNTIGIRPYTSTLESGFFRGAATTLAFGDWNVTAFASRLRQDASIKNDTTYSDFEEFVNSIQSTGYHRTANESNAKNQVTEFSTGLALDYQVSHQFSVGATGLLTNFSRPLQKKPNNYNQFEFSGNQNLVGSLFANYNWQNFIFFGEAAISQSGGFGGTGGFISSLSPVIDFSMIVRKYERDFHSFYANGFSEGSRSINEEGIYWGLKFHPTRKYEFSAYFDKFRFPWLRYRVDAPSEGFEFLGRFSHKPSRSVQLYVQYREEHKQISEKSEPSNLSLLVPISKRNYTFNVDYAIGRFFSLKTRAQGSSYTQNDVKTHGFALIQDLNVGYSNWKLSTRFALFDTDDFNNAQYIYERDVLYAFSVPAYYRSGTRNYFLIQYKATRALSLWLKYANFSFHDGEKIIGSGLAEIEGNKRSEIKAMMRYKFQ